MYRVIIIMLISGFSILGNTDLLYAQGIVAGRLTDTDTKEPLQGAHVFLSGTKIGAQTDRAGRYFIRDIPPGFYRLVISRIGYGRKTYGLNVRPGDRKNIDLSLKQVVYEMSEIDVAPQGRKWQKNYERFEELFLGYTEEADSTVILNPEVLRFDSNFWGRLTAEALAPLKIENHALGYYITYYLDEFKHTGIRTFWDGEPLFTAMIPSDSLQQIRWEENRRKAFYGSMRHFWLSLLHDRLEEEGFLLYNVKKSRQPGMADNRWPVTVDNLVRPDENLYLYRVQYSGFLEVIFTQEAIDPRYLDWTQDRDLGPGSPQISWLELNERSITVDADGEVIEPYGVIQLGYFGFRRLADLTPRGYRPDDF
ncbi:MAG: carboxypeptidase-like regulatory domain-containing protein [Gracilimonas sp.]|uniref:carboxypeptidase-like regulatory domain-containing protein n=1 Tax=Gracilimonas sp. TaxID=1974203 RepID=UPI0019CEE944|nr:carboxypeptidase-like regulatory domain-containing protein [Gracilimonas sp.]MBD3617528.1 carboxypeptidase-like regulatory domain-containing protein [Gracilimonas sp.]